jgi:isoquinoline 1-oxidoreductase beta subunit
LKDPKLFKLIGTPAKRLDTPLKVNGSAVFGIDAQVQSMQYAAIVNCPVMGGTLVDVDDSAAMRVYGVTQVVKIKSAVAVVGATTWAAKRGAAALKITWNDGDGSTVHTQDLVDDLIAASKRPGAVARNDGDTVGAFQHSKSQLSAVYQQPFLAHATMEPVNCTVHVQADKCELWVGTQVPTRAVAAAVAVTGLPAEKIELHNYLIGGGFGRKLEFDWVTLAVSVGMQVKTPVKVFWTREEDIQHDMFRPYYYDVISAALDDHGKPVGWQHRIVGSSILARFAPPLFKDGLDPDAVEVAAALPYAIANQHIEFVRQEPRHIPTAFWRGVGPNRSTYVVESFIDELAHSVGTDPVEYRRTLLGKTPRLLNVLNVATARGSWGKPMPHRRGRGVSVMDAFGTFIGMVVELTVDEAGSVKVDRVICVVDCGMVVNPDTVEAQMESGIVFGITAALYGEVTFRNGRVEQSNFSDYRVLRMSEMPIIEVEIIKSSEAPGGIGEPGTAALTPALLNAVFAATGKRIRTLPVGKQLASA